MKSETVDLKHLDTVARAHYCQVETQDGKRVYTARTLTACDEIYQQIENRAQSDAVEIRQGVGSHYLPFHPNPLTKHRQF